MDKIIIVFCEGDHDIAFLNRVLCGDGYVSYNKKIKEFPKPFSELFKINIQDKDIGKREFKYQRPKRKVPYSVVQKDDNLVIFHNLDGDDNILNYSHEVVDMYIELNDEILRKSGKYDILNFRFLYFVDADDIGVADRMKEFSKLLDIKDMKITTVYEKETYELGCGIFYTKDDADKKGKLEDIVLSLMKPTNKIYFDNALEYLNTNMLDEEIQKKFTCKDEKYIKNSLYIEDKSIIATVGQLQFSGASNAMIISNSDMIKNKDIDDCKISQDILEMFR